MRTRGWLVIALAMVLAVMFLTPSCTKKAVQSQAISVTEPAPRKAEVQKTEPQKAEVRKAPDKSAENAAKAGAPEDYRRWAEDAAREAAARTFLKEHVHFAYGSSLLSDEARKVLHGKAEYLRTNPDIRVTVEGHCDDRGSNAYNIALGERRAESVRKFLVDLGIGSDRLSTVSYGEDRPIATGHDEASWSRNRRAQFAIN